MVTGERERKILEFNQEQHCSVIRPFRIFKDMKVLQRCANPHFLIIIIYIIPIKSQNRGQENSQDLLRMLLCSIQVKPDFSGARQCLSPARESRIKAARVESSIKTFNPF